MFPPQQIDSLELQDKLSIYIDGSSLFVSFVSLLVSIITLLLALRAYKKFLNQKLAENQLNLVLQLISAFQSNPIKLIRVENKEFSEKIYYDKIEVIELDIFYLASLYPLKRRQAENWPIFRYSYDSILPKALTATLLNPILPASISRQIRKLNGREFAFRDIERIDKLDLYFITGINFIDPQKEYLKVKGKFYYKYFGDFGKLIKDCFLIRREMTKWLKAYGIRNLNSNIPYSRKNASFFQGGPDASFLLPTEQLAAQIEERRNPIKKKSWLQRFLRNRK